MFKQIAFLAFVSSTLAWGHHQATV